MNKTAPSPARLVAIVAFALSCFGILLFLWTSFGGPAPFKAEGYRFRVAFDEATQLSQQADVRISGVPIGRVVAIDRDGRRTEATVEVEPRFAPVKADSRAILRLKTLLGETYVELTPGSPSAAPLADGGRLADTQVEPTTELDEVLGVFDPRTRRDLQRWVRALSGSLRGRGQDLNATLGNLPPTAASLNGLAGVLHAQRRAVSGLVRDGGTTFRAIGRQEGALRQLVTSGDRVLARTAARGDDLTAALEALPPFLRALRPALTEARGAGLEAAPVIAALRPVAPRLRPTLLAVAALAPDAEALFRELPAVIDAAGPALPALTRTVEAVGPLVEVLEPTARELLPIAQYLHLYRHEFVTMWANIAASTQARHTPPGGDEPLHLLRFLAPITNEAQVDQPERLPSNRHNPYLAPRALDDLGADTVLRAFDCQNLDNPARYPVLGTSGAPPCLVQEPPEVQGRRTAFPRLRRAGRGVGGGR